MQCSQSGRRCLRWQALSCCTSFQSALRGSGSSVGAGLHGRFLSGGAPPFLLRQVLPSLQRALQPIMLLRRRWRRPLSIRLRLPPKPVLITQVAFSLFRHTFLFPGRVSARQWSVSGPAILFPGRVSAPQRSVSGPAILIWVRCLVPARWALHISHKLFQFSCIFLTQFLLSCFPQGDWTSICIARSVQTRVHSDSRNLPGSKNFSVTLGDFTGGELWLAGEGSVPTRDMFGRVQYGHTVCTRHSPHSFSCDTLHATMPWHGVQLTRHPGLILCQLQLGLSSWSWASHFRAPRGPLLHPLLPSGPRLRGAPVAPSPAVLLRLFLRLWRPVASAACRLISSGHLCQAIFCLM